MIEIDKNGPVFVLTMQAVENRFNRAFVDAFNAALDEVEASQGPAALVTTGGSEKFYSNGLDLDWMLGPGVDEAQAMLADMLRLLGRILASPVPSVAAINGHVFAAGAMLAAAHDFRVMRADRGYFCLPEIDLRLPLADGMAAVLAAKLPAPTLNRLLLTGERVGGADCAARGIVDESVVGDQVLARAIERATALAAKRDDIYASIKRSLYGRAIDTLREARLPA